MHVSCWVCTNVEDYLLVLMDSRLLISCVADFEEKVVVMCHGNIEIIEGG